MGPIVSDPFSFTATTTHQYECGVTVCRGQLENIEVPLNYCPMPIVWPEQWLSHNGLVFALRELMENRYRTHTRGIPIPLPRKAKKRGRRFQSKIFNPQCLSNQLLQSLSKDELLKLHFTAGNSYWDPKVDIWERIWILCRKVFYCSQEDSTRKVVYFR